MPHPRKLVILPLATAAALAGCRLGGAEASAADPVAAHAAKVPEGSTATLSGPLAPAPNDVVADVAESAVRAVVHIAKKSTVQAEEIPAQLRMFMPEGMTRSGPRVQHEAGSGVLVDANGLILTNNHVVKDADDLQITLSDGRRYQGKVRAADPATDLALVEIVGKVPSDLPVLRFGNSDRVRLGESVLAIGSPFELQGTVTLGILSARGRALHLADYEDFLQTDAAINPGNSGGALVNLRGELVGINTAIGSRSGGYDGIGFAIPSNLAQDIMGRLLKDGKVVRGFLGVAPEDVDPRYVDMLALDVAKGALISNVVPDSAAAKAGLKPYDVIVAVDGEPIDDRRDFRNTVALKGAGTRVAIDYLRDGKPATAQAVLGALPDQEGVDEAAAREEAPEGPLGGVRLVPLDDGVRAQLDLEDRALTGAVIAGVAPGSDAAEAGLQPGDVIVEVDRQPVTGPKDVARALKGADRAMLLVQRGPNRFVVFLG